MVEYSRVNVKLTDTQLKEIKQGEWEWVWKHFKENYSPHELLLTTRQKPKLKKYL